MYNLVLQLPQSSLNNALCRLRWKGWQQAVILAFSKNTVYCQTVLTMSVNSLEAFMKASLTSDPSSFVSTILYPPRFPPHVVRGMGWDGLRRVNWLKSAEEAHWSSFCVKGVLSTFGTSVHPIICFGNRSLCSRLSVSVTPNLLSQTSPHWDFFTFYLNP